MTRILVIKLGALGDVVLAFGPFAAIRARHPWARITLLTTAPFAELARAAPWFDEVAVDRRPRWWNPGRLLELRRGLRDFDFTYDLQTSDRSGWYFRLAGRPPWSGVARGCSHPHANPDRDRLHTLERQREQLAMAGVEAFPAPDLGWLRGHALPFDLPAGAVALVPGAAPHRPEKRWPAERFGELARRLGEAGRPVAVVGTAADRPLADVIRAAWPAALDLTGRTSLLDLAAVLARAALVVGNDTGPTHLGAAVGARCVALFSGDSDPALTAPRGGAGMVRVVRRERLGELEVEAVWREIVSR